MTTDNPQAFPKAGLDALDRTRLEHAGMALRDYFAAKAMQGIISTVPHLAYVDAKDVATEAFEFADAMLSERAITTPPKEESK